MDKLYKVFFIQAYESQVDTRLLNSVELQLVDETYEKALERAKAIIKKDHYRLMMVVEKYHEK